MPSIFERIDNRAAFPVEINGGTAYVKEPTFEEMERVKSLIVAGKEELSSGLSFALLMVTADGALEYPPTDGESDEVLGARVGALAKKLTPSALRSIQAAIKKLTEPVDPDELAKNS